MNGFIYYRQMHVDGPCMIGAGPAYVSSVSAKKIHYDVVFFEFVALAVRIWA